MKYDALIFDIDGTLWTACPATVKGWNSGLEELGIAGRDVTTEDIESVAGKPYEECVETLFSDLKDRNPEMVKIFNQHEEAAIIEDGGTFYDGAIEGIQELSKKHEIILVSNCQSWYLEAFLEKSGLRDYLKFATCYGHTLVSKGETLAQVKEKFNLQTVAYIGDTRGDEIAATSAGMDFYHAAYGFGEVQNPVAKFDKFAEIVSYFS